jgi:hypothetical protein
MKQHAQTPDPSLDDFLYLFFAPSASSQRAGRAFWEWRHLRKKDVDPPTSPQTMEGVKELIISIRERGKGIDPNIQDKLFS